MKLIESRQTLGKPLQAFTIVIQFPSEELLRQIIPLACSVEHKGQLYTLRVESEKKYKQIMQFVNGKYGLDRKKGFERYGNKIKNYK